MAYETTAPAPETTGAGSGPRAGFWQRFGAYVIDVLIIAVPELILIAILPDASAAIQLIWIVVVLAYSTYFEGGPTGQTIGKRALGIRVYDLRQGGAIGHGRAFLRTIGRWVSGLVLLLGYLWMLWDGEKQTWHDKFAGSVVVPTSDYPTN